MKLNWNTLITKSKQRLIKLEAKGDVNPKPAEVMMGLICLGCILMNLYMKFHLRAVIFMLNPCHMANFLIVYLCFSKYSFGGELVAYMVYGLTFGGLLGLIFPENEGLSPFYVFVYVVQHIFVAFLAPLVFSHCGRYDIRDYKKFPLPLLGGVLFSTYERYVLMPISLLSWANLNHSLCDLESDPVYILLGLGKWYWFWAEVYLSLASFLVFRLNCLICDVSFAVLTTLKQSVGGGPDKKDK